MGAPRIVCFYCGFGWGYAGDKNSIEKEGLIMIPVTCSSKVDSIYILEALQKGVDGVLLLGCPEGRCHFEDGNFRTEKKVLLIKKIMDSFGIPGNRLRMIMSKDPGGNFIQGHIEQFLRELQGCLASNTIPEK